MKEWGYLRETTEKAKEAGVDKDTGVVRTGLNEYLAIIFPDTDDWIHDKSIGEVNGKKYRIRPDYRSDSLKLIVEFDGLQHYTNPAKILKDVQNTQIYESAGYKVVRIPYFIQLSQKAVKTLFNVDIKQPLFDETIPSMGISGECTPAFLCPAGLKRMAKEFKNFPEQYVANVKYLKEQNNSYLTGVEYLEEEYSKC